LGNGKAGKCLTARGKVFKGGTEHGTWNKGGGDQDVQMIRFEIYCSKGWGDLPQVKEGAARHGKGAIFDILRRQGQN